MNKVLMILTHDRLDCLQLCLEMLDKSKSLTAFDRVVLLLNGVNAKHMAYVQKYMADHPEVCWDTVEGPGTRPQGISYVQNECIKRYPDSLYVKVDEDIFVPSGWAERMFEAYEQFKDRDDLALITPLIPNNAYGLHRLCHHFYPEHLEEHRQLFSKDPTQEPHGLTWQSPDVGGWATRLFIDVEGANQKQRDLLTERGEAPLFPFCKYFSIGCICYDYRHIEKMGGIPERDEPEWCGWIEDNHQLNILDQSQIVLHYSFFVQQDWLDRTPLLEDIRRTNLPDSISCPLCQYTLPRYQRFAKQIPRIIKRRLSNKE